MDSRIRKFVMLTVPIKASRCYCHTRVGGFNDADTIYFSPSNSTYIFIYAIKITRLA